MMGIIRLMKLTDKSAEQQLAILTCAFADDALDAVENVSYENEDDAKGVTQILELLKQHHLEGNNEIFESFKFFQSNQRDNESITVHIAAVRTQAVRCNFGELKD